MGILLFLLVNVILLIFIITSVSSVKICSNETQIGEQVILRRLTSHVESCGCSVKLVNGDRNSTVMFKSNQLPGGCQYKLEFNLKTKIREYSCRKYLSRITFTLTSTDQLYINLVNDENSTAGFTFNLIITVPIGQQVNVTCRSPWKNPLITTQTSSPGRGSPFHPRSTIPATVEGTTVHSDSTKTVGGRNLQYDSTTGTSRQIESTETTDRSQITEETQNSNLPVIVGCTVSGVVLVVIVIIVICFLKRRKQKHQTDQNVSDQNITVRNVDPDNYDNITYTSSPTEHLNTVEGHSENYDHIPNNSSQKTVDIKGHSDNYDHIPNNSSQDAVDISRHSDCYDHIPNNSSQDTVDISRHSDCYDHIPNNSSPSEHQNTVDLSRHSDCYDHIPNNSIQTSSDKSKPGELAPEPCEQLESVPVQPERVPNTIPENGVVKKKTKKSVNQDKGIELNNKPNKTIKHDDYENVPKDNLNLKKEINRIVGPKGDNYTQVNKC